MLLCTRNRSWDLKQTLESLSSIEKPAGEEVEFIVIDNGSTDDTRQVVELAAINPRYVFEKTPGLANARNRALAEASGDILVFVDDDLRFSKTWLAGLLCSFETGADAVAGCVHLAPHLHRDWMTSRHETMLASTANAEKHGLIRLTGANMAFKRSVLEKVPAFDPNLGAGALGFCEESLFDDQLRAANFNIARAMESLVEHHFSPDRLETDNLKNAAYRQGRSLAYVAYHWKHDEVGPSALTKIKTYLGHLRRKKKASLDQGISIFELDYMTTQGYWAQLKQENGKLRNYEKEGLVFRSR